MRRFAGFALAAIVAAGCGSSLPAPSTDASRSEAPGQSAPPTAAATAAATPLAEHLHGEPLDAGPTPNSAACDARLRSEETVAAAIRTDLRVPEIAADPATIAAVAKDPAASTDVLGIPLTAAETAALRRQGMVVGDPSATISNWVNVGAPDRFGGVWIDPPGSNRYVVAIVNGDPATLALARCLERVDTRYAWANLSIGEGRARAHRIGNDMQALRAQGMEINGVGYRENEGNVVVGVTHPSTELLTLLLAQYGPPLRLEEMGPAIEY
jgi:hypothetical protein